MTQIVVLHYPAERARNWALLRAAARERGLRLVSWAPHLLGLWCADGQQFPCYAGKPARPGIVIHRTVAPFRGIAAPVLTCLAAQGSLVLNHPDAAFRSRDKLLTTMDLVSAGIPVVPTAAFDEPGGASLAAPRPGRTDRQARPRHPGRGDHDVSLGRGTDRRVPARGSHGARARDGRATTPSASTTWRSR